MTVASPPRPGAVLVKSGGREFWSTGKTAIKFIETFCVFSNARWTGERFVLQPWQKKMLMQLFEIDPDTGLRRYRRALIGIPRKNGKTELCAALALYFMLADGERSAEIYCAAASEEQADRVFMAARRMCEIENAPLSALVHVPEGEKADYLTSKADPYSSIKRLTSKGKTKHGLNIHVAVLDEVHAWGVGEAEELWAALTTGMASREQPMMLMITTAGTDLEESRCGGLYLAGRALERGEHEDEGFFFRWWEAPEELDYRDPEAWAAAMPNLGVSVTVPFLKGELAGTNTGVDGKGKKALTRAEFERLYLNRWIDYGETPWVTREQIRACRLPYFPLVANDAAWVGVDLAETRDATAVSWAQWRGEPDRPCAALHAEMPDAPCLYLHCRTWEQPRRPDGRKDEEWEVPQSEVKAFIRGLNSDYNVATNVFDPWHSKLMRQDLENEGLVCEEIPQTGIRRSGASASLYDLIIQKRLHYCDDTFERHVMNATIRETGNDGGYYLAKRRKGKVMDAAMAAVNVVYGTGEAEAQNPSIYETRGIIVL